MHCIVLARCHPAFYNMDTVPYYDQHIRLYSAHRPSINAAMTSHCGTPKNIPKVLLFLFQLLLVCPPVFR